MSRVTPIAAAKSYRELELPVTRRELQKLVGRKKSTIFAWEAAGMPVFVKAAGGNLYLPSAVFAWLRDVKGWKYDQPRTQPFLQGEQAHE